MREDRQYIIVQFQDGLVTCAIGEGLPFRIIQQRTENHIKEGISE